MAYIKPLPQLTADNKAFWDGCREHQLRFQKCPHCALVRWPPSIICPNCLAKEVEWIVASGKGKVFSYAIYHQAFDKTFEKDIPYITAIIELQEGPRLLSNLVGCVPEDVKCDLPVEVVWVDVNKELSLPKFRTLS